MEFLDRINLSEMRYYDTWQEAALGRLLQMGAQIGVSGPVIAMRTEYTARSAGSALRDALLVITGEQRGTLVFGEEVTGPAIDVTDQLEIVARDAAPALRRPGVRMSAGMLLGDAATGSYFIWAVGTSIPGTPKPDLGLVCVRNVQKEDLKGKFVALHNAPQFVILAEATEVGFRADRTQASLLGKGGP